MSAESRSRANLPSKVLSDRLRQLRTRREWSQNELADRMRDLGYSWVRSTVAKVETGAREVNVDEMVALAWVLGVSPAALIVPTTGPVQVGPNHAVDCTTAWAWIEGRSPHGGRRVDEVVDNWEEVRSDNRFYFEACPDFIGQPYSYAASDWRKVPTFPERWWGLCAGGPATSSHNRETAEMGLRALMHARPLAASPAQACRDLAADLAAQWSRPMHPSMADDTDPTPPRGTQRGA